MFSPTLRAYFRSGWAFLIPYLVAYLLYAWLKWPVNPASAVPEIVNGISDSPTHSFVPPLLHVYWAFHAINLALGVIVLRSWWGGPAAPSPLTSILRALAPWLCLALLFWIPGIYLEWPSDPWEHLRRINEWHVHDTVTAHSVWTKSSYFLPYSLTGHTTGLVQLSWLNIYYTAICMLLCWQYYLLARAVGLGKRASFIFVLINALTFGNNVFSFYRYYGLSSSIFAQLGAVAFSRMAVEYLDYWRRETPADLSDSFAASSPTRSRHMDCSVLRQAGAAAACLAVLIAFNHFQGLGIAALGLLAVAAWRLIDWKRSMVGWLAIAAVLLSAATVRWFPRNPALDGIYRPQGWLTAWYGFNVVSSASPAFERSFQILGTFGVLNLVAGMWLLRRNHLAGWLTVMPVLALLLPCFALPLAHMLAAQNNIITFQRFLFATPAGLALAVIFSPVRNADVHEARRAPTGNTHPSIALLQFHSLAAIVWRGICLALLPSVLLLALTLPPGRAGYNRFWQSIQKTADDLQLKHYVAAWGPRLFAIASDDGTLTITSPLGTRIREAFSAGTNRAYFRNLATPAAALELERQLSHIGLLREIPRSISADTQILTSTFPSDWTIIPFLSFKPAETRPAENLIIPSAPWLALSDHIPEKVTLGDIVIINNPVGAFTSIFNSSLIPIDHGKRYQLSSILQQSGTPVAINYLAVAWYDRDGNLLESNQSSPHGAGAPTGWANGTYSYYCLVGLPAPPSWTRYTISFGQGEMAAIPDNAAFMRAGALLNYQATPNAKIELTRVVLREKPGYARALLVLPRLQNLCSPYSIAAQLSGHWLPQKASVDQIGSTELRAALSTHSN